MNENDRQKILKAGRIARQVREYTKGIIKKRTPLLEIAEKIEEKVIELGGKPSFPTNLSIDNIAAHYTPLYNDEASAHGLLKIDFGVHIDGFIADTAFSIDLENSEENKKLIEASEKALKNSIKKIEENPKISLNEIGKEIQETIESYGFSPVINLSGHSMEKYELHSGITIPNIDNKKTNPLSHGIYAIEPFATTGIGKIHDGKPSGIYVLQEEKNTRNPTAREVLNYIIDEYKTLPFCSRWIVKKFGVKSLFALKELKQVGCLHEFEQLVESPNSKVSQAEQTILIDDNGVAVIN